MPAISPVTLTVGGQTVVYNPVNVQIGRQEPSKFQTATATLQLDLADVVSHSSTAGPENRNISVRGTNKFTQIIEGIETLYVINGWDVKLSFPKQSTAAQRTKTIDTMIAWLTSQKAMLITTEAYY